MGFWHTGYIEFHEPSGLGEVAPPRLPVYHCAHCGSEFGSLELLRAHRFAKHPLIRPILFIREIEVGDAPLRITTPLRPQDVILGRVTQAQINGKSVSPGQVGHILASTTSDVVRLDLANDGVSASFVVDVAIADPNDLAGVEQCFLNVARGRRLDLRAIEEFIADSKHFTTAVGYCDGLCEYLYGVLAKEQVGGTSLNYEEYRVRFNRSAALLKDFHRPLPDLVRALIAFHFNQYDLAARLGRLSRVGAVAKRFQFWLKGTHVELTAINADATLEKLLTDLQTEQILEWSALPTSDAVRHLDEVEKLLHRDVTELDRVKIRVILTEIAITQKDVSNVRRHARELAHDPTFARWSESVLDHVRGEAK